MKKWLVILLCLCLFGCSSQDFETVADEYTPLAAQDAQQVVLSLPSQAAVQAVQTRQQQSLYFFEEFTLTQQTFPSGDLDATLREVTGYSREKLTLIPRTQDGCPRYDFVWSCAGEGGDQLCRGSILDDGSYHYVIYTMAPEAVSGKLSQVWADIFRSFTLQIPALSPDTGPVLIGKDS